MIYTFGITQQGKAHIKKNINCQDAYCSKIINEKICIAAVADGLGSEKHSDIASRIAADCSVAYCTDRIRLDLKNDDILEILKDAYEYALNEIEKKVVSDEGDISQYDTTLSLCVLFDGKLYFGHSGDSGIIALSDDGIFNKITEQQRDDEGRVYPLCFGEKYWVFGCFEKKVAGVILATDGMLELFYPVYIKDMDVDIYTSLGLYFLNFKVLESENFDIKEYESKRYNYVLNIPENIVDDDKTIVGIMDSSILIKWQNNSYYQEPDWSILRKKYRDRYNKKAYLGEYDV